MKRLKELGPIIWGILGIISLVIMIVSKYAEDIYSEVEFAALTLLCLINSTERGE